MKEKYKRFIANYTYRYFLFFFVFVLLFQIVEVISSKKEHTSLFKEIASSVFHGSSLESEYIDLKTPEKHYKFLVFKQENSVVGYGYPITMKIYGSFVSGWVAFDKNLNYINFQIIYWENHTQWMETLKIEDVHKNLIQAINKQKPYIYMESIYSSMNLPEHRSFFKDNLFVRNLNVFQERVSVIAYDLRQIVVMWNNTKQLLSTSS